MHPRVSRPHVTSSLTSHGSYTVRYTFFLFLKFADLRHNLTRGTRIVLHICLPTLYHGPVFTPDCDGLHEAVCYRASLTRLKRDDNGPCFHSSYR